MTKTDIEWLEYANEFHYGNHPEINTAVKHAIEALERTRWIPVSERLPDDSELVMLFAPAGTYTDFDWYDFGIYHKGSNSFLHIGFPLCAQFLPTSTHWMPLPAPPEMIREEAGHWDGIAPDEHE